jgi:hypothetical protein
VIGITLDWKTGNLAEASAPRIPAAISATFSKMDSTRDVSANKLGLCDRHHISSATNILGLAFRNAALIIPDEDES